jgi:hypothetical protein
MVNDVYGHFRKRIGDHTGLLRWAICLLVKSSGVQDTLSPGFASNLCPANCGLSLFLWAQLFFRQACWPGMASVHKESLGQRQPGMEHLSLSAAPVPAATRCWTRMPAAHGRMRLRTISGPRPGNPRWSPGGCQLAFDSRLAGNADI